ncbi:MAG TPA: acyl-CoA carboxylase subunit epsilon [Pseudonocardiaceae bacterium]|nr:acyl-CoA carboxylase subunit epsilon [Pseudonocardiaceae bacterium]
MSAPSAEPPPEMRIIRGEPSDDELAALVTVLTELARAAAPDPAGTRYGWADPAQRLRTSPPGGPGGWRVPPRGHRAW